MMDRPRVVSLDALPYASAPGRTRANPFAAVEDADGSVLVVRLEPGVPRRPHRHVGSSEVIFVTEGSGRLWADGETTPVTPGSLVYVPRQIAHATLPDPGERMVLVCFFPQPEIATDTLELDGPLLTATT